jgi:hypothetical protein
MYADSLALRARLIRGLGARACRAETAFGSPGRRRIASRETIFYRNVMSPVDFLASPTESEPVGSGPQYIDSHRDSNAENEISNTDAFVF